MDDNGTGSEPLDRTMEDDALLVRLAEMFREEDPPPAAVVELAKRSFGLRTLDAELAALTADSLLDQPAVAVREGRSEAGPRLLTFEAADLVVEVEVSGSGEDRRVLGQLLPPDPARIEVRQPAAPEPRWIDTDDHGRFVIEDLDPGLVRLTCHQPGRRPVTTEWTGLD